MLIPEVSSAAYALIAAGFRVFVSPSHDNSIVVACYHDGKWHLGSLQHKHDKWYYFTKHIGDLQIGSGFVYNEPTKELDVEILREACLSHAPFWIDSKLAELVKKYDIDKWIEEHGHYTEYKLDHAVPN